MYITYKQPERYHQLTFDELMRGASVSSIDELRIGPPEATRTVLVDRIPKKLKDRANVTQMIEWLSMFNSAYSDLRDNPDRQSLYKKIYLRKKSGGWREVNAPCPQLKNALTSFKDWLSSQMMAYHHSAAFAYVQKRSIVDVLKRHQEWDSRWFLKLDIHDFFGSTTFEFVSSVFSRIYPFCLLYESERGRQEMEKALSLCFLNGGLPQGTPVSPMITNIMMIPFDHRVSTALNNFEFPDGHKDRFIYTRYSDDMYISCRVDFDHAAIENFITETLKWMNAPLVLNSEKTHYGSRSGKNYMLGLKLNKENNISVGHEQKKELEAMIVSYLLSHGPGKFTGEYDPAKTKEWSLEEKQHLFGLYNYYKMVEKERIEAIVKAIEEKFGYKFEDLIKGELKI